MKPFVLGIVTFTLGLAIACKHAAPAPSPTSEITCTVADGGLWMVCSPK